MRKIIIGIAVIFCSTNAFPAEYSKCIDGDYESYICDAPTVDDTDDGIIYYDYHDTIDYYYGPKGYEAVAFEKKARCEFCRPGAGGHRI